MEVRDQLHALDKGLGGPWSRSGRGGVHKNSRPLPGLEPPDHTARSPVLYRWAIPAPDQCVLWVLSPETNREENNLWCFKPTPQYAFMTCCLGTRNSCLTFIIINLWKSNGLFCCSLLYWFPTFFFLLVVLNLNFSPEYDSSRHTLQLLSSIPDTYLIYIPINMVTGLRIPGNEDNLLTTWQNNDFSGNTLLHGVT
jgi:hypothetical protein